MKKTLTLCALLCALTVSAAESWWSDVSISPYGTIVHPNLDKPVYGAGLDVGYFINKTVSLHLANTAYQENDWKGAAIDETSVLFRADLIRNSTERFVGYILASGDRDWRTSDWAFGAGVGAEVRLSKYVSLGVDSRIRAWFNAEKDVQTRGFLSLRF